MLNPNCTFHILAKHRHILGAVTVGSALTFGTHVVNVKVTDACGRSGQQKLSVNVVNMVSRENWRFKARRIHYWPVTHFLPCICFFYFVLFTQPPEILNLPSSVDVVESIEHETLLYNLTLRDQSGNDTITCSLSSTLPTGAPFLVKYISGTSSKLIVWYLIFCVCAFFVYLKTLKNYCMKNIENPTRRLWLKNVFAKRIWKNVASFTTVSYKRNFFRGENRK